MSLAKKSSTTEPCDAQALQAKIFTLDEQIRSAQIAQSFAETGVRFAVAICPNLSPEAILTGWEIASEGEKFQKVVRDLHSQRAKLVAKFEQVKKRSCRGCPGRCIVNV